MSGQHRNMANAASKPFPLPSIPDANDFSVCTVPMLGTLLHGLFKNAEKHR